MGMRGFGLLMTCVVAWAPILVGCGGWQRQQVRTFVVKELDCAPKHAVARGPYEPAVEDGIAAGAPGERVYRGSCDLFWDERVVAVCDRAKKECRVVDVGPPRQAPVAKQQNAAARR